VPSFSGIAVIYLPLRCRFGGMPALSADFSMKIPLPTPPSDDAPVIDAEQAEFMQSGVSINAGTCSPGLVPNVVRALGCSVSSDRRRVRLLVSVEMARICLENIRATGRIAVTFVRPSTHRAMQIKGHDAVIADLLPNEHTVANNLCASFLQELLPLGYKPEFVQAVMDCPNSELMAVEFTPSEAFLQTPGPRAGQPLKAGP